MSTFNLEEPPNPYKRCRFIASVLKDVFSNCHNFGGRLSSSSPEEEEQYLANDSDDEQEVVLSVIRSRAMEAKLRRKAGFVADNFSWVFSPVTGELFITPKEKEVTGELFITPKEKEDNDEEDEDEEEFLSAGSCFSLCSTAASRDVFLSVKTNFSRCSSLNGLDFQDFWRRSIIQELCHCEGWPFGLCRKAVLLPPLPKSPSESWLRRKGTRIVKMH